MYICVSVQVFVHLLILIPLLVNQYTYVYTYIYIGTHIDCHVSLSCMRNCTGCMEITQAGIPSLAAGASPVSSVGGQPILLQRVERC